MENISTILIGIFGTALTAIASWAVQAFIKWINGKIKTEAGEKLFADAMEVVTSTVKQTYQVYIESIKGTDAWTKDAQDTALNNALTTAKALLSTDVKDYIAENFGDITTWLNNEIEAKIYDLKNNGDCA